MYTNNTLSNHHSELGRQLLQTTSCPSELVTFVLLFLAAW
jgi:hypothetical protein